MKKIYLVEPFGERIAAGEQRAIVRAREDAPVGEPCLLVSGHRAYGVLTLAAPDVLDPEAFDAQADRHCVEPQDRLRWWPTADELYVYDIASLEAFPDPVVVQVPAGVRFGGKGIEVPTAEKEHGLAVMLPVPADAAEIEAGDGFRPQPCDRWHVTLAMIDGDADADQVAGITQAVCGQFGPVQATVTGVGRFLGPEHAVVVLLDSADARELHDALVDALAAEGVSVRKQYSYNPHLTLGYVDTDSVTPAVSAQGTFDLDKVELWTQDTRVPICTLGEEKMEETVESISQGLDKQVNQTARRPTFEGTENTDWGTVPRTMEDYVDAYFAAHADAPEPEEPITRVGQMPQDMRTWIAETSLLGNANAELFEHLVFFPVVNPQTLRLNANALRAVLSGRGAQADIPRAVLESARDVVRGLLESEFERAKESEEKVGRRVREGKLGLIQRVRDELSEAWQALQELLSWAEYQDDDTVNVNVDLDKAFEQADAADGVAFAFKAADGETWWMQWTTNAFEDREREIFSTDSIDAYVARHEADDAKGQFWFWHVPGTKFGDVKWQARVGRFLVQAGPFDDTEIGQTFKEFFERYPDGHSAVAPLGWGCSHGYTYKALDRADGVYDWFDIHESTVLPAHVAANIHNPAPTMIGGDKMNDEQKRALDAIGGEGFADKVQVIGEAKTKELEEAGVAFKQTEAEDAVEETEEKAEAEVEAEPEVKAETETESEVETEPDDKMMVPENLAQLVDMVEDADVRQRLLLELTDIFAGIDEEQVEEETVTETEPEVAEAEDAGYDEFKELREEVREVLRQIVETQKGHGERLAEFEALTDGLQTLTDTVQKNAQRIESLAKSDEEKLAEVQRMTPKASTRSLYDDIFGASAKLTDDDELREDKPKETEAALKGPTMVPFINELLGGE